MKKIVALLCVFLFSFSVSSASFEVKDIVTQQNEIAGFWDWMFNRDNWPCYNERYFTEGCYRDHEAGSRG